MSRHKIISRFGLMHMIAANLCEWLYVLVEETKHEIIHLGGTTTPSQLYSPNISLADHQNKDNSTAKYCQEGNVMGSLIANASPFLFPCTIEYSLICAVILFEMWKKVKISNVVLERDRKKQTQKEDKGTMHFNFSK